MSRWAGGSYRGVIGTGEISEKNLGGYAGVRETAATKTRLLAGVGLQHTYGVSYNSV